MASIADGTPEHDPYSERGWVAQVLRACWKAVFEDRWAPWVRLVLTAIVAVGLYLAVQHLA